MCGLAGRFHPIALPDAPGWHARADALLAHRGPDGGDHFRDQHCEMVHRRLAIVDLSPSASQPLANEDGSVWVVFNGEIYNHAELRRWLEPRGHRFRSQTDTEVLVHLYEEYGTEFVERLRGMFAFALYDARQQTLLLVRDRFGVKPLFYTLQAPGGQLVFASEMKAIAALPGLGLEIDRQACYDFLGLGYVPEPATGFAEIRALEPGTLLVATSTGMRSKQYHRLEARPDARRQGPETVAALAAAVTEAVASQAVADVPVAALLSGGIDSSLVVAAHHRARATLPLSPPDTFTVRCVEPDYDESALARAVSAWCETTHHVIDTGYDRLTPQAVFDLIRHFDQPFADTSFLPTYLVAAGVRSHGIRCTLSGDGGDEAFGGYATFWRTNRLAALMRTPPWFRRAATRCGLALTGHTRDFGRQLAKAAALSEAGSTDSSALLAGLASHLSEEQKADLVPPDARDGLLPTARLFDDYRPIATRDPEELSRRLTETLFTVGLTSDMLRKVDMMSMRASIEVRVPLLDEQVVALGLSLPHRLKTDGRRGKLMLRSLARRWLPPEIAAHPKQGFAIPTTLLVEPSFPEAVRAVIADPGAATRHLLDRSTVHGWLTAYASDGNASVRNGRRGRGGTISRGGLHHRIFSLLALELWLREFRLTW